MALLWFMLALATVDLAAVLYGADTRPGFEHAPRWRDRRRTSG